jgi:hypothetical protein
VLRELLEEEVGEVVGPKAKWNLERTAVRHGHENGEVTLGGRRVRSSGRASGPLTASQNCRCGLRAFR